MKAFFTYVWGAPGNPAYPITFATKASRTRARKILSEGDLIFTVCTKGKPTDIELQGRVVGVYRASDIEISTKDYDVPRNLDNPEYDSITKFPYALHPLEVWQIQDSDNVFSEVVGPLTPKEHLQAQAYLVELSTDHANLLGRLEKLRIEPMLPRTALGRGRVIRKQSKLAPKHEGKYTAEFKEREIWYVYLLVLHDERNREIAVKLGYAGDPSLRLNAYNAGLATEVTGLSWQLDFSQPVSSEDEARAIEQKMFKRYQSQRLESNGEILRGVNALTLGAEVGKIMRQMYDQ